MLVYLRDRRSSSSKAASGRRVTSQPTRRNVSASCSQRIGTSIPPGEARTTQKCRWSSSTGAPFVWAPPLWIFEPVRRNCQGPRLVPARLMPKSSPLFEARDDDPDSGEGEPPPERPYMSAMPNAAASATSSRKRSNCRKPGTVSTLRPTFSRDRATGWTGDRTARTLPTSHDPRRP